MVAVGDAAPRLALGPTAPARAGLMAVVRVRQVGSTATGSLQGAAAACATLTTTRRPPRQATAVEEGPRKAASPHLHASWGLGRCTRQ